jgi:hypothetical protein
VVDCGGVEVILTSRPVLVFEANHFRSLGRRGKSNGNILMLSSPRSASRYQFRGK